MLVSREEAYARRELVTVAYVTTRARRIRSQVPVGRREGLDRDSVVNCDLLATIDRDVLRERLGSLAPPKLTELDDALRFALGIG